DEQVNTQLIIDPLLSPNEEGQGNEKLIIGGIENFSDNEVRIFNRWGNELFFMKGYDNKERVFRGYANKGLLVNTSEPLADGVYFYIIITNEINGGQITRHLNKGYLILKR